MPIIKHFSLRQQLLPIPRAGDAPTKLEPVRNFKIAIGLSHLLQNHPDTFNELLKFQSRVIDNQLANENAEDLHFWVPNAGKLTTPAKHKEEHTRTLEEYTKLLGV